MKPERVLDLSHHILKVIDLFSLFLILCKYMKYITILSDIFTLFGAGVFTRKQNFKLKKVWNSFLFIKII